MLDRKFWKNRRVFLTGHTGFKGSWVSLWLNLLGADVTGYALKPPTEPNLFEQANISSDVYSIIADIRDFSKLKAAIGAMIGLGLHDCAPGLSSRDASPG